MPNVGFREIADRVRTRIVSGELAAGAAVPSEAALASEYGVSRTTARRALMSLEEVGLIRGTPGRVRLVRSTDPKCSPSPAKYEQIAAAVRADVEGGTVQVGQLIGTEDALAERFGVSPGTVRRALRELADEGIVASISGRGWFKWSEKDPPTRTSEIATGIRSAITSGEWAEGARLPGELALAARYGVGRVTVRRALAFLESEGVVARRGGGRVVVRSEVTKSATC